MADRYEFTLTGVSPLLVHGDNVLAADELMKWRKDPSNKSVSVAGDDRSPAWTWQTYLYGDGKNICMISDAVMVSLRFAGSKMTMKKQESYKSATQSGILIHQEHLAIIGSKGLVPLAEVAKMRDKPFEHHVAATEKLGFILDIRRAVVGTSKHVRVRPRFDQWKLKGTLEVTEQAITKPVLDQLFDVAGARSGIGDWRPSAKKSGTYGRFTAELKAI
jgi:hypothetical protein